MIWEVAPKPASVETSFITDYLWRFLPGMMHLRAHTRPSMGIFKKGKRTSRGVQQHGLVCHTHGKVSLSIFAALVLFVFVCESTCFLLCVTVWLTSSLQPPVFTSYRPPSHHTQFLLPLCISIPAWHSQWSQLLVSSALVSERFVLHFCLGMGHGAFDWSWTYASSGCMHRGKQASTDVAWTRSCACFFYTCVDWVCNAHVHSEAVPCSADHNAELEERDVSMTYVMV